MEDPGQRILEGLARVYNRFQRIMPFEYEDETVRNPKLDFNFTEEEINKIKRVKLPEQQEANQLNGATNGSSEIGEPNVNNHINEGDKINNETKSGSSIEEMPQSYSGDESIDIQEVKEEDSPYKIMTIIPDSLKESCLNLLNTKSHEENFIKDNEAYYYDCNFNKYFQIIDKETAEKSDPNITFKIGQTGLYKAFSPIYPKMEISKDYPYKYRKVGGGLVNEENFCFFNAFFQSALNLPQVGSFVNHSFKYRCNHKDQREAMDCILCEFIYRAKVQYEKKETDNKNENLHPFNEDASRTAPDYVEGYQFDSMEVFGSVTNKMNSIMMKNAEKRNFKSFTHELDLPLNQIFNFMVNSQVFCKNGHYLNDFQPFTTLYLEFKSNFAEAMHSWSKVKRTETPRTCHLCNEKDYGYTQEVISTAPKVLAIALKRYTHEYNRHPVKITDEFVFPKQFDLKNFANFEYSAIYELNSLIIHVGPYGGGHYYTMVKGKDGKFYILDDESVDQTEDPSTSYYGKRGGTLAFYTLKQENALECDDYLYVKVAEDQERLKEYHEGIKQSKDKDNKEKSSNNVSKTQPNSNNNTSSVIFNNNANIDNNNSINSQINSINNTNPAIENDNDDDIDKLEEENKLIMAELQKSGVKSILDNFGQRSKYKKKRAKGNSQLIEHKVRQGVEKGFNLPEDPYTHTNKNNFSHKRMPNMYDREYDLGRVKKVRNKDVQDKFNKGNAFQKEQDFKNKFPRRF